jgi:hypothetical protein
MPSADISFKLFLVKFKLNGILKMDARTVSARLAIIKRQKVMEKAFNSPRNLVKIADVPKSVPAVTPSIMALFLFFARIFMHFLAFAVSQIYIYTFYFLKQ